MIFSKYIYIVSCFVHLPKFWKMLSVEIQNVLYFKKNCSGIKQGFVFITPSHDIHFMVMKRLMKSGISNHILYALPH